MASRKASQETLNVLTKLIPELAGGSADLTGSNLTKSKSQKTITPGEFGRKLYPLWGEGTWNGCSYEWIVLHGGFIPYGGTFLIFTIIADLQ